MLPFQMAYMAQAIVIGTLIDSDESMYAKGSPEKTSLVGMASAM